MACTLCRDSTSSTAKHEDRLVKGGEALQPRTIANLSVKKSHFLRITCNGIPFELHVSGGSINGCNDGQHQSRWR